MNQAIPVSFSTGEWGAQTHLPATLPVLQPVQLRLPPASEVPFQIYED